MGDYIIAINLIPLSILLEKIFESLAIAFLVVPNTGRKAYCLYVMFFIIWNRGMVYMIGEYSRIEGEI